MRSAVQRQPELEPCFDFAEKVFGTSGTAWSFKGQAVGDGQGGKPYAADRSSDFPLPAQKDTVSALFGNPVLRSADASSLINSVLKPGLHRVPSTIVMPPFG